MSLSKDQQSAKEIAKQAAPVFLDVHGFKDSKANIKGAEYRAISVTQLRKVLYQIRRRCKTEGWKSYDGTLLEPSTVTLYDVVKYIVLPVTAMRKCSYVEMVANGPQPPSWFVSHYWGEPVEQFVKCLEQHASDHMLDEDNTYYWVCGYANNQWDLKLGNTLKSSPFYKAMQKAEGTVSILDQGGIVFERIWCGYELYESILKTKNHKWCVYTCDKYAVGLTEGIAPADSDVHDKWVREKVFPKTALEGALNIDIGKAEASVPADKKKILATIGNQTEKLNKTLKGRFASAGIRTILESGDQIMWENYLRAIFEAKPSSLTFYFFSCKKFDESKQEQLRKHIHWKSLNELKLDFSGLDLGDSRASRLVNEWRFDKIKAVELKLDYSKIGNAGAKAIARALKVSKSLKVLDLTANNIGDDGAIEIGRALEKNASLKELKLSANEISNTGTKSIAMGLKKNKSLEVLHLSYIAEISPEVAKEIGNALEANKSLKILRIYHYNCDISDDVAIEIGRALEKNTSLKELYLSHNISIWSSLEKNAALKEEYLSRYISNNGAESIARGLKKNKSLEILSLLFNNIGSEGAKEIADALKVNKTLTALNLGKNRIGNAGAIAIGNALLKNQTLKELIIVSNEIENEGAKALVDGLKKKKCLRKIDLRDNSKINQAGIKIGGDCIKEEKTQVAEDVFKPKDYLVDYDTETEDNDV